MCFDTDLKLAITGPFDSASFMKLTGVDLTGAPKGMGGSPVVNLAAEFYRRGMSFAVITLDPTIGEVVEVIRDRVRIIFCPFRGAPNFKARVRAFDMYEVEIQYLLRALQNVAPDLVHAHWTYEYAEAAVRSGFPHLVTMHDVGWRILWFYLDAYRLVRLIMKLRVMPRIRRLAVVAPYMCRLARFYGYFGPVEVLANGVDIPAQIVQPCQKIELLPLRIVTIGDAGPRKNVRVSVEALHLVRSRLPDTELHLFGPGLDDSYASGQPGVIGHGNIPHNSLMQFLEKDASLLVHPSLEECCPMIVLEAKARGLPIVGGVFSGGVPFACGTEVGSALVNVKKPDEVAKGILSLLSEKLVYQSAAALSRQDAIARFSIGVIVDQHIKIYNDILSGN